MTTSMWIGGGVALVIIALLVAFFGGSRVTDSNYVRGNIQGGLTQMKKNSPKSTPEKVWITAVS